MDTIREHTIDRLISRFFIIFQKHITINSIFEVCIRIIFISVIKLLLGRYIIYSVTYIGIPTLDYWIKPQMQTSAAPGEHI